MTFLCAGYNFDILESFQSYIHNLAENMGINVDIVVEKSTLGVEVCMYDVYERTLTLISKGASIIQHGMCVSSCMVHLNY